MPTAAPFFQTVSTILAVGHSTVIADRRLLLTATLLFTDRSTVIAHCSTYPSPTAALIIAGHSTIVATAAPLLRPRHHHRRLEQHMHTAAAEPIRLGLLRARDSHDGPCVQCRRDPQCRTTSELLVPYGRLGARSGMCMDVCGVVRWGMCHVPFESSRRGGHSEYWHVFTRALDVPSAMPICRRPFFMSDHAIMAVMALMPERQSQLLVPDRLTPERIFFLSRVSNLKSA